MGVDGLKNYTKGYFEPYELKNSLLIVDGGVNVSITHSINDDPRFDSNYQLIYDKTYEFFKGLISRVIIPIVVMDGRFKEEKEVTMGRRVDTRLSETIQYNKNHNFGAKRAFPIFKSHVFFQALDDLGICYCRSDFEADEEIIQLAKRLECPVLSSDYDFCLCDGVEFIPYELMEFRRDSAVDCMIFRREFFLRSHGIAPSVLPYLAVIFNGDYIKRNVFDSIFPNSNITCSWKKYQKVLSWLRNVQPEVVRDVIVRSVKDCDATQLHKEIDLTFDSFTKTNTTLYSTLKKHPIIKRYLWLKEFDLNENDLIKKYGVPAKIAEAVRECRLMSSTLDMFTHKEYKCRLNPIEDMSQLSPHEPSIPIIEGIYGLLIKNLAPLKLEIRNGEAIQTRDITAKKFQSEDKYKILCEILEIDVRDIDYFDNGWFIFILSYLFWIKKCRVEDKYKESVLLTALILHFVKRKRHFNPEIDEIKNKTNRISYDIKDLNPNDCEKIADHFNQTVSSKRYLTSIHHIHQYLTFQTCVYHLTQVFTLLDLPQKIRITEFVSGILFHEIFTDPNTKPEGLGHMNPWLNYSDNLNNLFLSIKFKLKNIESKYT